MILFTDVQCAAGSLDHQDPWWVADTAVDSRYTDFDGNTGDANYDPYDFFPFARDLDFNLDPDDHVFSDTPVIAQLQPDHKFEESGEREEISTETEENSGDDEDDESGNFEEGSSGDDNENEFGDDKHGESGDRKKENSTDDNRIGDIPAIASLERHLELENLERYEEISIQVEEEDSGDDEDNESGDVEKESSGNDDDNESGDDKHNESDDRHKENSADNDINDDTPATVPRERDLEFKNTRKHNEISVQIKEENCGNDKSGDAEEQSFGNDDENETKATQNEYGDDENDKSVGKDKEKYADDDINDDAPATAPRERGLELENSEENEEISVQIEEEHSGNDESGDAEEHNSGNDDENESGATQNGSGGDKDNESHDGDKDDSPDHGVSDDTSVTAYERDLELENTKKHNEISTEIEDNSGDSDKEDFGDDGDYESGDAEEESSGNDNGDASGDAKHGDSDGKDKENYADDDINDDAPATAPRERGLELENSEENEEISVQIEEEDSKYNNIGESGDADKNNFEDDNEINSGDSDKEDFGDDGDNESGDAEEESSGNDNGDEFGDDNQGDSHGKDKENFADDDINDDTPATAPRERGLELENSEENEEISEQIEEDSGYDNNDESGDADKNNFEDDKQIDSGNSDKEDAGDDEDNASGHAENESSGNNKDNGSGNSDKEEAESEVDESGAGNEETSDGTYREPSSYSVSDNAQDIKVKPGIDDFQDAYDDSENNDAIEDDVNKQPNASGNGSDKKVDKELSGDEETGGGEDEVELNEGGFEGTSEEEKYVNDFPSDQQTGSDSVNDNATDVDLTKSDQQAENDDVSDVINDAEPAEAEQPARSDNASADDNGYNLYSSRQDARRHREGSGGNSAPSNPYNGEGENNGDFLERRRERYWYSKFDRYPQLEEGEKQGMKYGTRGSRQFLSDDAYEKPMRYEHRYPTYPDDESELRDGSVGAYPYQSRQLDARRYAEGYEGDRAPQNPHVGEVGPNDFFEPRRGRFSKFNRYPEFQGEERRGKNDRMRGSRRFLSNEFKEKPLRSNFEFLLHSNEAPELNNEGINAYLENSRQNDLEGDGLPLDPYEGEVEYGGNFREPGRGQYPEYDEEEKQGKKDGIRGSNSKDNQFQDDGEYFQHADDTSELRDGGIGDKSRQDDLGDREGSERGSEKNDEPLNRYDDEIEHGENFLELRTDQNFEFNEGEKQGKKVGMSDSRGFVLGEVEENSLQDDGEYHLNFDEGLDLRDGAYSDKSSQSDSRSREGFEDDDEPPSRYNAEIEHSGDFREPRRGRYFELDEEERRGVREGEKGSGRFPPYEAEERQFLDDGEYFFYPSKEFEMLPMDDGIKGKDPRRLKKYKGFKNKHLKRLCKSK